MGNYLLVNYKFIIEIQAIFIVNIINYVLSGIFVNVTDHNHVGLVHLPSPLKLALPLSAASSVHACVQIGGAGLSHS